METALTTPDHYTTCHHSVNSAFINDHEVNVTFMELAQMSSEEFQVWINKVRVKILEFWDAGTPPRMGLSDYDINASIDRIDGADLSKLWLKCDDGSTGLTSPASAHGFIAQWFPTMMKTRINYSEKDIGISVYDMFAKDKIWARYAKSYAFRHFRRDSFFAYTRSVHTYEELPTMHIVPKSAIEYMQLLRDNPIHVSTTPSLDDTATPLSFGILLTALDNADQQDYTGYSTKMKDEKRKVWWVTADQAKQMRDSGEYPAHWFIAVLDNNKQSHYIIRLYDSEKRIFPDGFRPFRISMCQYAVNWPSLAARALYEKFTEGVKSPVIYDPSAGWGGRLFGAITMRNRGTYIACDPNTDHLWTDSTGKLHSKYTELAAYYSDMHPLDSDRANVLFFPVGSETMRNQPEFQKYKGKVNVAFTSPPYFMKELYSEDANQSAKKFSAFEDWCEEFLKPTIETAAEWLVSGGYLLWNIADAKFGNKVLPLEAKSIEYALNCGLVQQDTIKLLLTNMPGANRIDSEGKGTARNTTKVNNKVQKYEPIFVFRKPSKS
jgi:hypothetical protein